MFYLKRFGMDKRGAGGKRIIATGFHIIRLMDNSELWHRGFPYCLGSCRGRWRWRRRRKQ